MRRLRRHPLPRTVFTTAAVLGVSGVSCMHAQRHSLGSAPPTAPVVAPPSKFAPSSKSLAPAKPAGTAVPAPASIAPVSSGLGPIQFFPASAGVPAPQTLTRQLSTDDERTRSGALSSLGAPGQYLGKGHVPYPHSVQLDLVQLGQSDQLDALLTVELDQHIVTAVLVPEGDNWRRVATLTFATSFSNATATPATFVRPLRSWLQNDRYRAVFHASVTNPAGDFTENEADLNIVNGHALIVLDFVSGARQCEAATQPHPTHPGCEITQRWLEPDPADPTHRFTLITGTGHLSGHEGSDPLAHSHTYPLTHLHAFTCQPFVFAEPSMRFQPTANPVPCGVREPSHPEHPEATRAEHPETSRPEHVEGAKPDHTEITKPETAKPERTEPAKPAPEAPKPEHIEPSRTDRPEAVQHP